ncbi:MAG: site-2 protease family protein [Thioalkalispiraceae bacterium]|jgi:Zn-dependent protease
MFLDELTLLQKIAVSALPILFAVVLHEVAHGWVARYCGDNTAWQQGRLSLNPLSHIDPIGTILVPLLLVVTVGFVFGWAKPVPINWANLRHPRRDMMLVAAAGPTANLLMALFWALMLKLSLVLPVEADWVVRPLNYMAQFGILVNIILMIFNLLPLPPLDGGRIAVNLLPHPWGGYLARVEPYGFFVILILLATGVLARLIWPAIQSTIFMILKLFGLA